MGIILGALAGAAKGYDEFQDAERKERENIASDSRRLAASKDLAQTSSDIDLQKQKALALFGAQQTAAQNEQLFGASAPASAVAQPATAAGVADASSTPGTAGVAGAAQSVAPTTRTAAGIKAISEKYGIPEEAVKFDLVKNGGKGIAKMIEDGAKPDFVVQNGVSLDKKKMKDGAFLPGVQTSASGQTTVFSGGEDGKTPTVSVPAGAAEAYGTFKGIDAGVKAATTPMKVFNNETKQDEYTTEKNVIDRAGGVKPSTSRTTPDYGNATPGAAENAEQRRIIQAEYDKEAAKDPNSDVAKGLQRELSRLPATGAGGTQPTAAPASATAQGGNLAAGPSMSAESANKAGQELNSNFVTKRYQPIIEKGDRANEMLTAVDATRIAMKQMGGTGWGAESRAKAASVLEGLGLANEKARLYAQNSQLFQNTAQQRLQVALNAATGPQTEGDAQRAAQTFASMANTTRANEFILDMAEALAQRDVIQAKFYAKALPAARESGDLTQLDRSWSQMQPSVFSMPSMKNWGKK